MASDARAGAGVVQEVPARAQLTMVQAINLALMQELGEDERVLVFGEDVADAREALLGQVPLRRIGTPREVAEMVGFLAGDGAAYVTGQVFHVNGGLYM